MSWPWRRSRSGWAATEIDLGDELGRSPERELGLDSLLFGELAQFLETGNLGLSEGLVGEVGERLTPPEGECLTQAGGGEVGFAACQRLASLGEQALEAGNIEGLRVEIEPVAGRAREKEPGAEELAQPGDVDLDHVPGTRRG